MKSALVSILLWVPLVGRSGELETFYRDSHAENPKVSERSRTFEQVRAEEREFTEVGLERPPWYFAGSPVYSVIIKPDGRFTYTGERNVEHLGKHTGRIESGSVKPLFQLIREMDYFALDENYSILATDQETVYTMVATAEKRKVVRNYGKSGPLKLWALENLIDALLSKASWDS